MQEQLSTLKPKGSSGTGWPRPQRASPTQHQRPAPHGQRRFPATSTYSNTWRFYDRRKADQAGERSHFCLPASGKRLRQGDLCARLRTNPRASSTPQLTWARPALPPPCLMTPSQWSHLCHASVTLLNNCMLQERPKGRFAQ